jgi:alpha(1,3/1,4) fucosyltransferase
MHIGFYNHYRGYNKNRMLTDPNSPIHIGHEVMYPFVLLAQTLKAQGHQVNTLDMDALENFDAVVFVEFPGHHNPYLISLIKRNFKEIYLIILESPIVKPDNYQKENHRYFKKIFTWADDLVDGRKYFKIQYAQKIPPEFHTGPHKKEKLCTLIASNQVLSRPFELYTERIRAIRWFENNHPEAFDLYGKNWDRYSFQGRIFGINIARLNRLVFLTKFLKPYYPSYKGSVVSKYATYQKYKFSICYENALDFKGYITEKIFDCFFGGTVPIYLGASNITQYIPENTFIDKRKFDTYPNSMHILTTCPMANTKTTCKRPGNL